MKSLRPLLLIIGLLLPAIARAQAAPPPPPPKHEQSMQASYVGVAGNASSNALGLGADVIDRPGAWVFRNRLSFVRNEGDGVVTASALDYTSRAQKTLSARASVFGQYEYFRDEFAGIQSRQSATGGVSVKAVNSDRQNLAFDLGAGYINEQRLAGTDVSSAAYLLGIAYRLKISDTAELTDDAQFSGVASDASNWRLARTISLSTRIASGFSLKLSNTLRYAHFPPPGFKTTDSITSVALVVTFAHP
jgi:putative salt-induced outer membrane protein